MVDRPWYAGGAPAPPPPLMAHLTCLGWCRLCRQGARGWWLLETGVSGWWSMTLVGGSGMISEWLTDPGMLVVHLPSSQYATGAKALVKNRRVRRHWSKNRAQPHHGSGRKGVGPPPNTKQGHMRVGLRPEALGNRQLNSTAGAMCHYLRRGLGTVKPTLWELLGGLI